MKADTAVTVGGKAGIASNPTTEAVAGTTGEAGETASNPTAADEGTMAAEIGIVQNATIRTSRSGRNATGAENRAVMHPPKHATIAEATDETAETSVAGTGSARKGEDVMTDVVAIGIVQSATTQTSPSARSATDAVSLVEAEGVDLATIAEADSTDEEVATASRGGTTAATATVVATNPSQGIGPATIAAPTISRAARRATSADRTLRTVAATDAEATDAAHARAEALEAETDAVVTAEARVNSGISEAETDAVVTVEGLVNNGISEAETDAVATVVMATAEAHGRTVVAVVPVAFDPRDPSARQVESQVGTLTTAGQNPSESRAGMTIEGESHGGGCVPRCPRSPE